MTARLDQVFHRVMAPPARRRFGIATGVSVSFHALVVLLVGLLAWRIPVRAETLIPIELTFTGGAGDELVLGRGGEREAPAKRTAAALAQSAQPSKQKPSSSGGRVQAAPSPPRILTSEKGAEPAGPQGQGKQRAGPGGAQEAPAGPTQGPGVADGPLPVYPKDALDRNLEGRVVLSVLVGQDGAVSSVSVRSSSGHALLDEAAVRAVKNRWSFEPALKEGEPVSADLTVAFEFSQNKVGAR